jgi:MFS family permease
MKSNIWKFYFLRIFLRSSVFPILVVYFLKSGLSAAEIGLVFSIGVFASFLLELPSGYISDKIGHRPAIILCFLMKSLAMLSYLGGTFWWFAGYLC